MTDETLKERFRGELIDREHGAYDGARAVHNAAIERRPRLIARCRDSADVQAVIAYARENSIRLAVRGGGHSGAGLGMVDDGVVADLSQMRGVRVDPQARTVRVAGGAVWGDVDHATHAFGLAVPSGVVATTGVGGLTLGGGHGYLTRKYGLTIDNLLEADVVLADGRQISASARDNRDLFWAIRGGGGNFGVVTSFLFQAQPVDQVYAGLTLWPVEQTREAMDWYAQFIKRAPDDVYGFFALMRIPPIPLFPSPIHQRAVCGVFWCHLGPTEAARQALAAAHDFGPPLFEYLASMPLPKLNSLFDPLLPFGLQWYWKGHFINDLDPTAMAISAEFGRRLPPGLSTAHLYPIDGAAGRVPPSETAFAYRDAKFSMVIAGIDPDPAQLPTITTWARDYWQAMRSHSAGGAYVNFLYDDPEDRVLATYRDNYARLQEVKSRYDPHNVFNVNWNIRPR
jgi:hypothetical protein